MLWFTCFIVDSLRFDDYFGHFEEPYKRLCQNLNVYNEKNVHHMDIQTGRHIDNSFILIQLIPNYPWVY